MEKTNIYAEIPAEKFEFADPNAKITDKKFDTKPIGYFKDAMIRFTKNKGSVVAAIIIFIIILYAIFVPMFATESQKTQFDAIYRRKGPYNVWVKRNLGFMDGSTNGDYVETKLVYHYAIGIGAESNGTIVSLEEGKKSYYQPVVKINSATSIQQGKKKSTLYNLAIDQYLDVGFINKEVTQEEYAKMLVWQNETGYQLLYPLIDTDSPFFFSEASPDEKPNYWFKTSTTTKGQPVSVTYTLATGSQAEISKGLFFTKSGSRYVKYTGSLSTADFSTLYVATETAITYSDSMILEDNYLRNDAGELVYATNIGGGDATTSQLKVRILYYNYYRYMNGYEPNYFFGTDSIGYDLCIRMASGCRLSLLLSVCVSVINLVLGALYGAVEGYYGGVTDLIMERISDILISVPFIIVATLFQMHLSEKVGAVPSLIFAFVLTGWIGTAGTVRTQFYRFKNQEYVMAARTLGAKDNRLIWKHIFPNTLGTLITSSVLVIPGVIFTESMLSFLGIVKLGGTETSLGTLLSDASGLWILYPHLLLFPAIIISLLMICFNLFGNGLRDAFNPSLRGTEE